MKSQTLYTRVAIAALICTFSLITLGGIVHNTGSSLACPDWPLCFGQVFPEMTGGVAIEHSHRLLGAFVGILTLILVFLGFQNRAQDSTLHKISWLALVIVIFQGVLGGVTVLLKLSPVVSSAHLATSQIFFATLLFLAWQSSTSKRLQPTTNLSKCRTYLAVAMGTLFLQMVLGAAIRHGGAAVACGLGSESLFWCNDPVTGQPSLWPELGPAKLHMIHRFGGLVTLLAVVGGTVPLLKIAKNQGHFLIRFLCVASHALVLLQVVLGVLVIRNYIGVLSVTTHLIVAALLWAVLVSIQVLARPRSAEVRV
jgi:heme A synthase